MEGQNDGVEALPRSVDSRPLAKRRDGDLRLSGPLAKRRLVLRRRGLLDRAADPHLAAELPPVAQQHRARIGAELLALGALAVGEEHEAVASGSAHHHHAGVGHAVGVRGRQRHRLRQHRAGSARVGQPAVEQFERIRVGHRSSAP